MMIGGMASSFIHIGEKINGDKDRIFIAGMIRFPVCLMHPLKN